MIIKKVSLIGLGALGIMYANHLSQSMTFEDLRIIADEERINRYEADGVYCNDEKCHFNYVKPETHCKPADLLIFTVKYTQLPEAIKSVRNHIGPDTIILSALNGVVSEQEIGTVYGHDHNLYCVAQGMDAVKENNQMRYKSMGLLCFGELNLSSITWKVKAVADFFDAVLMPYEINNQMDIKLWSKLMVNVGVNQAVAVAKSTTAIVQGNGPSREQMIGAMEEVLQVANAEGIHLTKEDITYWINIVDGLNPGGMPSMAQDIKAKRYSEVALFSGTIIKLAAKNHIDVPVNQSFFDRITDIEKSYTFL